MAEGIGASSPIMYLVGGPQGSGKSTFFPVSGLAVDSFNIDEERKRLNGGSSWKIPPDVQKAATEAYERFIEGRISAKKSFAIEVTLAREVTFEQAKRAREAGFSVRLYYIAAELAECTRRMAARVEQGGHGVREAVLKTTHAASLANLDRSIQEFDHVEVYDNSRHARFEEPAQACEPRLVLEAQRGAITKKARRLPQWLRRALKARKPSHGKSRG